MATKRRYPNVAERLAAAKEREGRVEATTEKLTSPVAEPVSEQAEPRTSESPPPPASNPPSVEGGRRIRLPNAATSPRSRTPPNYKIHVLTALGLALLIRVTALGTKALVG